MLESVWAFKRVKITKSKKINAKTLVANRQKFIFDLHLRGFYQTTTSAKCKSNGCAIGGKYTRDSIKTLFWGILEPNAADVHHLEGYIIVEVLHDIG